MAVSTELGDTAHTAALTVPATSRAIKAPPLRLTLRGAHPREFLIFMIVVLVSVRYVAI
jgi:hypothetical protein